MENETSVSIPEPGMNYPGNSYRGRAEEKKSVQPVAHGTAVRRRRTFKEWLTDLFFEKPGEEHYDFFYEDIIIPATRDFIEDVSNNVLDSVRDAIGIALFGSAKTARRRRSGYYRTSYDDDDYEEYWNRERRGRRRRASRDRDRDERTSSRRRSDDVAAKVESRQEALDLIHAMQERVHEFKAASVLNFYDMADMPTRSTDDDYGWDLGHPFEATVTRVRDGYIIEPVPPVWLDR